MRRDNRCMAPDSVSPERPRRRGLWLSFWIVQLAAWVIAVLWLTLRGLTWTPENLAVPAAWIVILALGVVREIARRRLP